MNSSRFRPHIAFILALSVLLHGCALEPLAFDVPLTLPRPLLADPPIAAPPIAARPPPVKSLEPHRFALNENDSIVGTLATVRIEAGETLLDLGRHFGLGFQDITDANPELDAWLPQPGALAVLPLHFTLPDAPRTGIVINLASMRLFYFPGKGNPGEVLTYPVGIGREGRSTPMGQMFIARKATRPTWYVPASIREDHRRRGDPLPASVPPGPDNPLGDYAMYLSRPRYLIHGTNKPYSVGLRASNGCIRLYPENMKVLFGTAANKTSVHIVNQPYLVGWHGGEAYLEAHAPYQESNLEQLGRNLTAKLKAIEKKHGRKVDWNKVAVILEEARGIPIPVFERTGNLRDLLTRAVALPHPAELYGQPKIPPMTADGWYIEALNTGNEDLAKRLAAFLNHQGPQIPARVVEKAGRYQVLAGPFKNAESTKTAAKRMKIDLEIEGAILSPDEKGLAHRRGFMRHKPRARLILP